jgi:formylglycine-generating enzyme required for sulfatase activity
MKHHMLRAALLGMAIAMVAITSCGPASTPTPTITPTIKPTTTSTEIPTATSTPTPEPSRTPVHFSPPAISEPGLLWANPIDGSDLVGVPAGEFSMGYDQGNSDEQPVHQIYLDGFYIGRLEVTNAQYRACEQAGECSRLVKRAYIDDPAFDDHPVVNVTLAWAHAYCEWANMRLPTEAEWEKAARGTDGRLYPWGEGISCDHAQYVECGGQMEPADSNPLGASPYGALNMAGNVWEWTSDRYKEDYYQHSPSRNPTGGDRGNEWVFRGGSWSEAAEILRSTYRTWYNPDAQYYNLGFRCVFDF